MQQKEFEFRAESCNLLCFKVIRYDKSDFSVKFKNGKREKEYSLEEFVNKMNQCFEGSNLQLEIVTN